MDDDNIEVVEVAMDDDNIEVVEVVMSEDDNIEIVKHNDVEIVEVLINGNEQVLVQVEVVSDDENFVGVFDISPLYDVIEEIEQIAPVVAPLIYRLAGVQHPLPESHNIGVLNSVCTHCMAHHFRCEQTTTNHISTCCNDGLMAVSGPRVLTTAPHLLQRLLVEDTVEGRHYRNNISRYNTLAFATFSVNLNTRRLPSQGPNVFTAHGQGYWTISNDLIGNEPIQRRYCQLYFVESEEANRIRRKQQQQLPSVLEDLDGLLRDINLFAQAYE